MHRNPFEGACFKVHVYLVESEYNYKVIVMAFCCNTTDPSSFVDVLTFGRVGDLVA